MIGGVVGAAYHKIQIVLCAYGRIHLTIKLVQRLTSHFEVQ